MAEREIYRVEIPIIVDDQTDAPLKQAERKISKFEKSAQRETERISKHFQHIAKYQIEPVMKVRDQLTASVFKADKLIKKLGMEQASPLIAAQDRVTSVITRIDAAMKALEKGDVTVYAEMQGPLIDEIVKAKAALSVLNNVRAGPVAELRGELFGQLTKAMSQIDGLDGMLAVPEATLRERVTWRVREISSSLRGLTSRAWQVTLDVKDKVTSTVKGIIGKTKGMLSSPLALLGVGGGIAGATGFGLNMIMEEQDLISSFEVMLGTREAAEQRMRDLITFAGQTPFTRQEIWRSSRVLELLTGGALSTGEGLRLVGDVAAGTVQPFEEVSMWIGRLYDGLASGRPIGEATSRLQEMGAISGEARARLEKLAESGWDISKIWPLAAKEFERFNGLIEKQSTNLRNIMLSTKTFFTENVIKRWGLGVAGALQPALTRFREWRRENTETISRMGDAIERFGRIAGDKFVGYIERAAKRMENLLSDPKFRQATFNEKVRMLVETGLEDGMAVIEQAVPKITRIGVNIGMGLGKGMAEGIAGTIAEDPKTAFIVGAIAGLYTPGPLWLKATVALTIAGTPLAIKIWDWLTEQGKALGKHLPGTTYYTQERITEQQRAYQRMEQSRSGFGSFRMMEEGKQVPVFKDQTLSAYNPYASYAFGGILTRPHFGLVAEAGPEAIIPLSTRMRPRALELWQQTGELLGVMPHASGGIFGNVSDRVSSIANTTESAAIAFESTRKGQELTKAKSLVRRYEKTTKAFARVALPLSLFAPIAIMGSSDKRQAIIKELGSILGAIGTGALVGAGTGALVSAGVMSPVTAMLGAILGAGAGAFGGQAAASALYDRFSPHATGGILTRPHLGLVAEAGPEAIIPLSARMRSRALALYEETGRRLGVRPYVEGGFAGSVPVAVPSATGTTINVDMSFDLGGLVRQVVINKESDIDEAVDMIADKLRSAFQNMVKK